MAFSPFTDEGWKVLVGRVAAAPERFWVAARQLIADSPDPSTAHLYGGALAALVGLGDEWAQRVANAARKDPRLASALQER